MAEKTDIDYFSQRGSFDGTEDASPSPGEATMRIKPDYEGTGKGSLLTPMYTPPPSSMLSPSSQTTVVEEEENLPNTSPKDNSFSDIQTPLSEDGFSDTVYRGRKATSPTPKLHIDTYLRPGSVSISSQSTPHSDTTVLSTSDSVSIPTLKIKVETTSPQNRPRSYSAPPKAFLPPLLEPSLPRSNPEPRTPLVPQSSIPQSAVSQSTRAPGTPSTLSRSASRRKPNAFIAHNPFSSHSHHADTAATDRKRDLTFDEIKTPIHLTPRVMFASGNEENVDGTHYPPSRDYFTPISAHRPTHTPLGRSSSQGTDMRRNLSSNRPPVGSRRYSSLRVQTTRQNHLSRRDSARSSSSAVSEETEESTIDGHQTQISEDFRSASATQQSPHPTKRRRDPFKHEDDPYDEESASTPGLPYQREKASEAHANYSTHDDPEKNIVDVDTSEVKTSTHVMKASRLSFRLWRTTAAPPESKESLSVVAVNFVASTLPRQLYLHLLFRLPLLYFSRVSRIFEEADLTLPEIKRMALETPQSVNKLKLNRIDMIDLETSDLPLEYQSLSATWEFFIDSLLREWKIINIISGLLLSAILTLLQIESAAENPFIRFTSLFSLICSLISLLYGCMYIIRFGTMRKPYKAAEWALEARNKTMIWWNVWVLLAMPAIWLTWSIILYIVCIMAFAWQTTSQVDTPPLPLSDNTLRGVRILLTVVLGLGVVYGTLIISTFSRYGEVMDQTWKERIDEWAEEKAAAASSAVEPEYSDSTRTGDFSDDQATYPSDFHPKAASSARTPTSSFDPSSVYIGPNDDGNRIHLPPPHELSGANLGKKPSMSKDNRRVRFQSPRVSPADSLGDSLPFDEDGDHEEDETGRKASHTMT